MIDLQTKYRKQATAVCLHNFHERFWNISVNRVAEILVKLGHGDELIWWVSIVKPDKRFTWTARKFGAAQNTCDMLAREVRNVEFYGGPPGHFGNHCGTLLTIFMDRLLLVVMRGGFNALDAVIPLQEHYL